MTKPFLAVASVALLSTAVGLAAVIAASSGGEEEAVPQIETATPTHGGAKDPRITPPPTSSSAIETNAPTAMTCDPRATPPPGKRLWRWLDLTVLLPEEGFRAFPSWIPPEPK